MEGMSYFGGINLILYLKSAYQEELKLSTDHINFEVLLPKCADFFYNFYKIRTCFTFLDETGSCMKAA